MKPHKHAELIKAWADGAEIECKWGFDDDWEDCEIPDWECDEFEFRIKGESKPDIVLYIDISLNLITGGVSYTQLPCPSKGMLEMNFDGETGELKSAEVLK